MHDTLPAEMHLWHKLENTVRSVFAAYGYDEIRVPVVEKTAVFARAIGEVTDVVEKEMYLSLIHISEPTRQLASSRMPSSA